MGFLVDRKKRISDLKAFILFVITNFTRYIYGGRVFNFEKENVVEELNDHFNRRGYSFQQFPDDLLSPESLTEIDDQLLSVVNDNSDVINKLKTFVDKNPKSDLPEDLTDFIDVLNDLGMELTELFRFLTYTNFYCDDDDEHDKIDELFDDNHLLCIYIGNFMSGFGYDYNKKVLNSSAGGTRSSLQAKTKKIRKSK